MNGRRWAFVAVGALVLIVAALVIVLRDPRRPTAGPPTPSISPSPPPPQHVLVVNLARLEASPVEGAVPAPRLKATGEAIRSTMAGLYSAAFIDQTQWHGGTFRTLPAYFAGEARREARGDVNHLSLGRAAAHVVAVRPDRARLDVRVVADRVRRPVAATAVMDFAGTGLVDGGLEVPIRHRGRYVLRLIERRWMVVAYDVDGRLGA